MMFCHRLPVRSPFTCKYSVNKSDKNQDVRCLLQPCIQTFFFYFKWFNLNFFASDELIPDKLQGSKYVEAVRRFFSLHLLPKEYGRALRLP